MITVEEHTIVGGLGGAVAEILAELPEPEGNACPNWPRR